MGSWLSQRIRGGASLQPHAEAHNLNLHFLYAFVTIALLTLNMHVSHPVLQEPVQI